jgi:Na+/H+-dicarboxylate symporter
VGLLSSIFRLKQKSLVRGVGLCLGAFAGSLHLAGFPRIEDLHGSPWQMAMIPIVCWGMVDTFRCLEKKWSLYHAGVLIMLYTELMILTAVVSLWIYS